MLPKILLIDDDDVFRSKTKDILEHEFYSVDVAEDGISGLIKFDKVNPDIVLLDVRMPGKDGLDVCREIIHRQDTNSLAKRVGIIMISGHRKEIVDKVAGLEIGADTYLTRPFEPRELLAEIKALWRRLVADGQTRNDAHPSKDSSWFYIDQTLRIDFEGRIVECNGEELHLTKLEFDVLQYLAEHANKAISRSELATEVWGWRNGDYAEDAINTCISKLRNKIEREPNCQKYIEAIRGVGYKLNVTID